MEQQFCKYMYLIYRFINFTYNIIVHIGVSFLTFTVNVLCSFACKQKLYVFFDNNGGGVWVGKKLQNSIVHV